MAEQAALGIQTPDSFKTIGSMLNFAGQAQNLQRGNIDLQQNQIKLQERKGIQDLFGSDPNRFTKQDGTQDYDAMIHGIMKVAPTTGPEFIPKIIQGYKDSAAAQQTLNTLNGEQATRVGNAFVSIANLPPQEGFKIIDTLVGTSPNLAPLFKVGRQHLESVANDPAKYQALAMRLAQSVQPVSEQRAMTTPVGEMVTNQEQTGFMNRNQQAGPVGLVPGTVFRNQIPLTERQKVTTNAVTQSPQVEEKDAFWNVVQVRQAPTGPGVPQLGPGGPQAASASGTGVGQNWQEVNASAQKAAQDIGVLQEIKKYAPGAVAGVVQDRRAFITGIAGLIGMDAAQLEKTNTDLLAKNSNMLALAGGDTNLAKELAQVANPNVHMTKEAILKAADQVIGQRQLAIARQKFLLPYISNPVMYNHALTEFNSAADPRVLQLPNLSDKEKIDMKKSMSPAEQKAFGEKIRKMQQLGILQ